MCANEDDSCGDADALDELALSPEDAQLLQLSVTFAGMEEAEFKDGVQRLHSNALLISAKTIGAERRVEQLSGGRRVAAAPSCATHNTKNRLNHSPRVVTSSRTAPIQLPS
jgi:hypothetical protein